MDGNMVKAGPVDSLTHDRPKVLSLMGKKVGIFKNEDGTVRALEMVCKHQGADLSTGDIRDGVVTCPRHGWRYDLTSGKCLSHEEGLPLRKHRTEIEDGVIYVSLFPGG